MAVTPKQEAALERMREIAECLEFATDGGLSSEYLISHEQSVRWARDIRALLDEFKAEG